MARVAGLAVRDLPRPRRDVASVDSLRGARLRVELGRARLRLAWFEAELDDRVVENASVRRALDFTRELLQASAAARVASGPGTEGRLRAWLELLVQKSQAAFPDAGVEGVAVTLQREGRYELAVGANVPENLVELLPAPDHRDFAECIRQHVPHAQSYPFAVADTPHWFVVLADAEIDNDTTAPIFEVVALEVERAMRLAVVA
jgi:hypothetical protein